MSEAFSDIKGRWSEPKLMAMVKAGVLHGRDDGLFHPKDPLTREEFGVGLFQFAEHLMELASANIDLLQQLVRRSTVMLVCQFNDPTTGQVTAGTGAGVFVGRQGHIMTNHHVVHRLQSDGSFKAASPVAIHTSGWETTSYGEGEVVAAWPEDDLAVVKFGDSLDFPTLPLGDDPVGGFVLACGAPLGVEDMTTLGIITETGLTIKYYVSPEKLAATDAAINPGNSGGALVNMAGQLVGIPSAKLAAAGIEGFGFAIPISTVKARLTEANIPFEVGRSPEPAKPVAPPAPAPIPEAPELSLDWPARAPITAKFGEVGEWWSPWHAGIDIACPEGSTVTAPCDAEVHLAAEERNPAGELVGFGRYLILWADPFWLLFGHLSSVTARDVPTVSRSQPIALSGSTGLSTGPHLHFGVYDSRLGPLVKEGRYNWQAAVDPLPFLVS